MQISSHSRCNGTQHIMTDDILNVALTYITIVQDLHRRLSVNPVHDDHTTAQPLQKFLYITKYSLNFKQMLPKHDVNML